MMKKSIIIILIAFLSGLGGAVVFELIKSKNHNLSADELDKTVVQTRFTNFNMKEVVNDFVTAAAVSTPSVVYIKTESTVGGYQDPFDWFFGRESNRRVGGTGSGVIFSSDGYIISNNHVIKDAEVIEVIHNKRTYEAQVVGTDPSSDLAVLKIKANDLPAVKIGRSKDLQVGEFVLAVGNPFNLTSTVTAGIVSAKGRNISIVNNPFPIESFIQTDAAINPGNSGGALINMKGELIGINTAILSRTGSYAGYGFAVPSDIVTKITEDIIKYGEVQKAFLGAQVQDVNTETAKRYELDTDDFSGVIVDNIEKESAAEKAGIKEGDIILKIDGEKINSRGAFDEEMSYHRPGDEITLTYKSDGKEKETAIRLINKEGTTAIVKREIFSSKSLGADLENVSKAERDRLDLDYGVKIVKVKGGLFGRLGIREGFIITAVNNEPIKEPKDVADILEDIQGRVIIEGVDANGSRGYYSFYF